MAGQMAAKLPALRWVIRLGEEATAGMLNFPALLAALDPPPPLIWVE